MSRRKMIDTSHEGSPVTWTTFDADGNTVEKEGVIQSVLSQQFTAIDDLGVLHFVMFADDWKLGVVA